MEVGILKPGMVEHLGVAPAVQEPRKLKDQLVWKGFMLHFRGESLLRHLQAFSHMTWIPTISVRVPRIGDNAWIGTLSVKDWSVPCVIGSGGLVAAAMKREGDRKTPVGVFPLRYGLFRDLPALRALRDVRFPFVPCSDEMIWEEDGPDYNRLVFAQGSERQGERLARPRDHDLFDVIIPIGYNDSVPEAGRGSALFIHAARPDMSGTAGCVAVRRDDLLELAQRLRPGMLIDIDHDD